MSVGGIITWLLSLKYYHLQIATSVTPFLMRDCSFWNSLADSAGLLLGFRQEIRSELLKQIMR